MVPLLDDYVEVTVTIQAVVELMRVFVEEEVQFIYPQQGLGGGNIVRMVLRAGQSESLEHTDDEENAG